MRNQDPPASIPGFIIAAVISAFFLMVGLVTAPQLIILALMAGICIMLLVRCLGPVLAWLVQATFAILGVGIILGLLVLCGFSPVVLFFALVALCIWIIR